MIKPSVLYITYDGILDPLGESQVLSYQELLSQFGPVYILSFEKNSNLTNNTKISKLHNRLENKNILWFQFKYTKSPAIFSTLYDVLRCTFYTFYIVKKYDIKIIHARSYVSSLIALLIKYFVKIKFIFDMRGFWADERIEGGIWTSNSYIYKIAKYFENKFYKNADHIVTLTQSSLPVIMSHLQQNDNNAKISVIPTCTNINKFDKIGKIKQNVFTLGYVGSVGTWYDFEKVVDTFRILRLIIPNSQFIIINNNDHDYIKLCFKKKNITLDNIIIKSTDFENVHYEYMKFDIGVYYYKPSYSRIACCPTKLSEFLASGVPCITNTGVGDTESLINSNNVGIVVDCFDEEYIYDSLKKLIKLSSQVDISERCKKVALKYFSLDIGVDQYLQCYQRLDIH